jgi:glutamate/tyrosine decarboxylase-like PLP-dependent enzyme
MGRSGVAELIERCCALARQLAAGLEAIEGVTVVNEVVLNQVLVRVGDESVTNEVESWIQREGNVWLGATTWRGERLIRVSVSNWSTTRADIDMAVDAIRRAVETVVGQ